MGDFIWLMPLVGCGLMMVMMVVMMWGMGKSMFSRSKEGGESGTSLDELRAEQERMAEEIKQLEARGSPGREREPTISSA